MIGLLTGCGALRPFVDDAARAAARVAPPQASYSELATIAAQQVDQAFAADAAAAARVQESRALTQTDDDVKNLVGPVCGAVVETLVAGPPENAAEAFSRVSDGVEGIYSGTALAQDAKVVADAFAYGAGSEQQEALVVLVFQKAYC